MKRSPLSRRNIWATFTASCLFALVCFAPGLARRGATATLTGDYLWVHDPSRATYCDGKYYVYTTGNFVPMLSSSDLIHWEKGPAVLDKVPDWMRLRVPTANGKNLWAPDVLEVDGQFWLFYSYSTFGSQVSAIGLLSSPTLNPQSPNYKWTDRGLVIATDGTTHTNAIDPAPFWSQNGDLWLSYGSWDAGGIQVLQLNKATGVPIGKPVRIVTGQSTGPEAPYIQFHDGYYYVFENEGFCCRGMNSTYRVMMGRSKSITGPYLDKEGKELAKGGGSIFLDSDGETIGPGHIGILSKDGLDLFTYHYYNGHANGVPTLGFKSLLWGTDGWPEAVPDLAGGRYAIVSKASGLALGVHNRDYADGTALDQFPFNGDVMQKWNIVPLGDGFYSIASLETGKYVDLFEGNPQNGTKINQQPWLNNDYQRWRIEAVGDGAYRLISKGGKTAVTVPDDSKAPLALMEGDSWTGAEGQKWVFRRLP